MLGRGRSFSEDHSKRVFFYHFSRVPPLAPYGGFKRRDMARNCLTYSAIRPYRFYLVESRLGCIPDSRLADAIQTYWTNFAKTAIPTGLALPHWPAYSPARKMVWN
jgi:hypothetical protein